MTIPDRIVTSGSQIIAPGPVPPAKPLGYFAYVRAAQRNLIETYHRDCYRQGIVETRFPGLHNFVVNDPAGIRRILLDNVTNYPKADIEHRILGPLLGNGLITSEGETWRLHRRMLAPFFDGRSVAAYAHDMVQAADAHLKRWDQLPGGSVLDMADEMMQLTLEIISRSMFSSDSGSMVDIVRSTATRYQKAMMFGLMDFAPGIKSIWGVFKKRRGNGILSELDAAIFDLIERRKKISNPTPNEDLLGRLLRARDDETGAGMTAREVRDQVFTMFAAGHETTALALTWTWFLLATHPVEEAMLHDELDKVLQGRPPVYEDLTQLPYTRMVLQEAMRLYPAVYTLAWRQAASDDEVGGHKIPKGATVAIVPWILHRHESFWKNPESFQPTRFSPKANAGRDRFAYLPFGFGPRVCIGAAFAMTEGTLLLAAIAQRYRLRLTENARVETKGLITLTAKYGMPMSLESR